MKKLLLLSLLAPLLASAQPVRPIWPPFTGTLPTSVLPGLLPALSIGDGSGLTNITAVSTNIDATTLVGVVPTNNLPGLLSGLSVIEPESFARPLSATVESASPLLKMSPYVMLEKLYTNYNEFAVYVPSSTDARYWARYRFTDRHNKTIGRGAPRLVEVLDVRLLASSNRAPFAANLATGITAPIPVSSILHVDATTNGTWIGPTTFTGATNVYYTATAGDYVEYSVTATNGQRLVWWTYDNTSFGHTNVQISILDGGGTPLPSTNWSQPATNISIRLGTGRTDIELARNLAETNYTIRLTAGAGAGASYRMYNGGLGVFNALDGTAPEGNAGTWTTFDQIGRAWPQAYHPGAARVYKARGTRLVWRHMKISTAGHTAFTVYDSTGAEISTYALTNAASDGRKYVDCYAAGGARNDAIIADNLPLDTYTVILQSLPTKNASAANYYSFDYGVTGFDASTAGTLGTDVFDLRHGTGNQWFGDATTTTLDSGGGGNIEYAPQVRLLSSTNFPSTDGGIITGVHGSETATTNFWIMTNGVAVGNWSTSLVDSVWIANNVQWGAGNWAWIADGSTNDLWSFRVSTNAVSSAGYMRDMTVSVLLDVTMGLDYPWMVTGVNSSNVTVSGWSYSRAVGSGFDSVLYGNHKYARNLTDASNVIFDETVNSVALISNDGQFAILSDLYDWQNWQPIAGAVSPHWIRRSAQHNKVYLSTTGTGVGGTRNYLAGDSYRIRSRWRYLRN